MKCSALPAEVASAQACSLLSILGNVAASVWPRSVHGRGILPFLRLSQGGNQQTSLAWWDPCLPVLQKQIPPATGLASGWHQRSLATQWPPWQARQLGEGQAGGERRLMDLAGQPALYSPQSLWPGLGVWLPSAHGSWVQMSSELLPSFHAGLAVQGRLSPTRNY